MSTFTLPTLQDISNPAFTAKLQHKIDNKTKPLGSLGQLEGLALQIGQILGTESPQLEYAHMLVFAGDHGLTARGVSAFPSDVTWQMVENFLAGGACVSVLSKANNITLTVVDCGVNHDFLDVAKTPRAGLLNAKVANGTADSSAAAAMTAAQCQQAIENGMAIVKNLPAGSESAGSAILLGEMGIGNTSAASLILSRLQGLDIGDCTGAGTGLDGAGIDRKTAVLREVLAFHAGVTAPLDVLAAFGGFEMATMLGAVFQAAAERRVIVVDGFITTAVILVAHALQPAVLQRCVFAHRSGERGHALMLTQLNAKPLLDMGLRLGEGSGAALAWPLLIAACTVLRDMASFESAGVDEKLI
ncbi:MAG: nicotinate-nucleotide--dimethylbenzimidazole phosphoribosyltransferase [Burkholderiaceae bacterium]